jgi:hypothetical protein
MQILYAALERRLPVAPVVVYGIPRRPISLNQVEHMAVDTSRGHHAMDYPEHLRTYSGFLRATMVLIAFVVAILIFLLTLVP